MANDDLIRQLLVQLEEELAQLTRIREQLKQIVAAARDEGRLATNNGYDFAREEQARNEAQISRLKKTIADMRSSLKQSTVAAQQHAPTPTTSLWVTREQYKKMQSELTRLRSTEEPKLKQRVINLKQLMQQRVDAAESDLQAIRKRIAELQREVEQVRVGTPPPDPIEVLVGMVVTVEFPDFGDVETFLLGSRELNAHMDIDVYSATSELGKAVIGRVVGEDTSYLAPNGKQVRVTIVDATPYSG